MFNARQRGANQGGVGIKEWPFEVPTSAGIQKVCQRGSPVCQGHSHPSNRTGNSNSHDLMILDRFQQSSGWNNWAEAGGLKLHVRCKLRSSCMSSPQTRIPRSTSCLEHGWRHRPATMCGDETQGFYCGTSISFSDEQNA